MKLVIKKILSKTLYYSGAISLTRKLFPLKEITVLMFHQVKADNFKEQIEYLRKYYNIISEKELIAWYYKNKKLPKNSIMLTFDDGYLNNYLHAWPILKKYKIPATIFLATGHINKQKMTWYDKVEYFINNTNAKEIFFEGKSYILDEEGKKRLIKKYYYYAITLPNKEKEELIENLVKQTKTVMPKILPEEYGFMNWKQINEMIPLITFGAHTVNHPILPNLTSEEKRYELEESKKAIRLNTKIDPSSLCYPNGDYDKETIEIAKELGYKIGFSSNFGRNTKNISPYLIQRIGANIVDTKEILATKLTRLSSLFQRTKTRKHFKVVMITNYFYPQTGGITTSVDNMVKNLRKNNIKTAILAYPNYFRKIESWFKDSRRIHRFLVILFLIQTTTYFLLNRIFYKKIIAHSHSANFCAFAGILAKPFGVKTVHTLRTDLSMNKYIGEEKTKKNFVKKINQITAVSKSLANDFSKKLNVKNKIQVIHNGVNYNFSKINLKQTQNDTLKILFVGHLFDIKNPFLFVKSMELLSKKRKISATMIGEGPLRDKLEKYIKKQKIDFINLVGSVKHHEINKYYEESDVVVLTSKAEGLGNVILEAMSSRTPVVATNSGGPEEIITHMKNGFLAKKHEPKEIVEGIEIVIKNKQKFTNNAIITIKEDFDWQKNTQKYINIYRQLTMEKNFQSSEENES